MAYIKVNHKTLHDSASEIRRVADQIRSRMKSEEAYVETRLQSVWNGDDSEQYILKLNELFDEKSSIKVLVDSLDSYANRLDQAAELYQSAQERAVSLANNL